MGEQRQWRLETRGEGRKEEGCEGGRGEGCEGERAERTGHYGAKQPGIQT